jgi:hypothetical protein
MFIHYFIYCFVLVYHYLSDCIITTYSSVSLINTLVQTNSHLLIHFIVFSGKSLGKNSSYVPIILPFLCFSSDIFYNLSVNFLILRFPLLFYVLYDFASIFYLTYCFVFTLIYIFSRGGIYA